MSVPYQASFEVGARVRIRSREDLEKFRAEWKYHHPLAAEQLAFAGSVATVTEVGFYHGGDVLYWLDGVPGVWHEQNLGPA